MCIAVVQKPGAVIDDASLYRGWTINNDGGGFAYVDNNDNVALSVVAIVGSAVKQQSSQIVCRNSQIIFT